MGPGFFCYIKYIEFYFMDSRGRTFREKRTKKLYFLIEEDFNHPNYGNTIIMVSEDLSVTRFVIPIFFDNIFEEVLS